nr:hypothetical protein CFP56_03824 [Quercus suber]
MPALSVVDSEHSLLQGHAAGRDPSSPWKITRQRIAEDDSRTSLHSMSGGESVTGAPALHERPDWPLSPTAVSFQRTSDTPQAGSNSFQSGNALNRNGFRGDDTLSNSEDEDDWEHVPNEILGDNAGATVSLQHANAGEHEGVRHEILHVARSGAVNVSSLGEIADPMVRELSPLDEVAQISPALLTSTLARTRPGNINGTPVPRQSQLPSGYHAMAAPRQLSPVSNDPEQRSHFDEEASDFTSPRTYATTAPSTVGENDMRSSSTSWTGDTAPINGAGPTSVRGHHTRISSTGHHALSRRSSQKHPTMEISYNKDRVRYSWQSVQDEGPNRPRINIIKLISNTVTASAAFPQGEAFGFSMSPSAERIAAYNSARLYVLQTSSLPVGTSQEYTLKRRPLAVELVDDGDVLAILADEHTINVYDIGDERVHRARTIKLDFPTNCIALAPTGGLLAAAYEGGVEIFSLASNALPTDRRAVRCQRMDKLAFSVDSSTLLGTTTRINISSTTIVSVPIFPASPDGTPTHEELKEAWCTELLHPESVRNSSHAVFFRDGRSSVNDRLFAWNGLADTFGILSVADLQYGNLDFPVVISPPLSTCGGLGAAIHSCPTIDQRGDTIAMIVNDRTIRLYIVPHDVDEETTVEAHSIDHELDEGYGCPFSDARWVHHSKLPPASHHYRHGRHVRGRLVVTSPGGVLDSGLVTEETVEDIEGGRIILFDFDPQFAGQPGQTFDLILGKSSPQLLEEAALDVAYEVALVRSRTVNQKKNAGLSQQPMTLGRTASTFKRERDLHSPGLAQVNPNSPSQQNPHGRRSMLSVASMQSEAARSLPDLLETSESPDQVIDEPYAQNAPRSHDSLQRAASNVQRHRYQTLEERNQEHISPDSNSRFLALPEYTKEPNAPLPSRFRVMAGLDKPSGAPSFTKSSRVVNAEGAMMQGNIVMPASPSTSSPHARRDYPESSITPERMAAIAMRDSPTPSGRSQHVSRIPVAVRQQSPVAITSTTRAVRSPSPTGTYACGRARNSTLDSLTPTPRSLRRAYSNAAINQANAQTASLVGDWGNVSPVHHPLASSRSDTFLNASMFPEDEAWDRFSPVNENRSISNHGGVSRSVSQATTQPPFRHSTSWFDSSDHAGNVQRAPSSASSFGAPRTTQASGSAFTSQSGGRRLPPHMQAFRDAAAALANPNHKADASQVSAAASLFPNTQAADHIPFRTPSSRPGSIPHPVNAWPPPAPSSTANLPRNSHGRKSSSLRGVAMTGPLSHEKPRRMGFFKSTKKKKMPFEIPGGYQQQQQQQHHRGQKWENADAGSRMETKSSITWLTRENGKCVVIVLLRPGHPMPYHITTVVTAHITCDSVGESGRAQLSLPAAGAVGLARQDTLTTCVRCTVPATTRTTTVATTIHNRNSFHSFAPIEVILPIEKDSSER